VGRNRNASAQQLRGGRGETIQVGYIMCHLLSMSKLIVLGTSWSSRSHAFWEISGALNLVGQIPF